MTDSHDRAPGLEPPARLPIFPLPGALLLPRARLPLNIFEPRYLAMVRAAMAEAWSIGMIQPREDSGDGARLFDVGCVGRITSLQETDDGRYLIVLTGTSRFRIARELEVDTPYRQVEADYGDFAGDLAGDSSGDDLDIADLIARLRSYLEQRSITLDEKALSALPDSRLVDYVGMVCPLETAEKQALLEAATVRERYRTLSALLQTGGDPATREPGRVIPFPGPTKH